MLHILRKQTEKTLLSKPKKTCTEYSSGNSYSNKMTENQTSLAAKINYVRL